MKRAFVIAGIVFLVCFIGLGVYYFFFTDEGSSQNPVSEYFPFGQPDNNPEEDSDRENNFVGPGENPSNEGNNGTSTASLDDPLEDFILVNATPTAGFNAQTTSVGTTSTTTIRYIEKDQGHIYTTTLRDNENIRISETEIPAIHDAYWSGDGQQVAVRYLSSDRQTIKDYLVDLASYTPEEDYTLDGTFLSDGIQDIALNRGSGQALALTETNNGSVVSRFNFKSGGSSNLFSSDFSEWNITWPNESEVSFTTKAAQTYPGHLYRLTLSNNAFEKVLDGVVGLTTLVSPDFSNVLYSQSTASSFNFYLYDIQTEDSTLVPTKTLPEKCVWETSEIFYCAVPTEVPNGTYPDDRYQGQVAFTDRIMRFNVNDVRNPEVYELDSPVDATRLQISGDYIFFLGHDDSSLWARRINN